MLCEVWSDNDMASRIKDREIIVTNNEKAFSNQPKDGKTESQEMASLSSTQEETPELSCIATMPKRKVISMYECAAQTVTYSLYCFTMHQT